ncbi:unnamed protein product [Didymodactylos carnosus]|uniref:Uncharacterized protein n=1 Tax=Didymodactylos carnosus TaxID=1234261 RepID=A0A814E7S2_9BILA|nr:unnamed protein product [Didymodactylos carnosus]CAF0964234.1 unnamed protein product [Didymodactylos carnosus]CAF3679308.1 unnamed protein product [Didymodactylos carnosus]CAF3737996.1 unnamed protein product [Didymodactylos carnosus]
MYQNSMSPAYVDISFRQSVMKILSERTAQDLTIINGYLKHLEALSLLSESHKRNLSKTVRYEVHEANHVLFSRGQLNTCWYILLSGSVFIESTMFLPRTSFGKRTPGNQFRVHDCLVLEPSEMLVIDYPDVDQHIKKYDSVLRTKQHRSFHGHHSGNQSLNQPSHHLIEQQSPSLDSCQSVPVIVNRRKNARIRQQSDTEQHIGKIANEIDTTTDIVHPTSHSVMTHSRASDTSSAYSGSDVMQLSTTGEDIVDNGDEIPGCLSMNESDDESEGSSERSFPVHDNIRESLMKEASERTEDDIEAILEFLQHFPAFVNLTLHVRRELCKVLIYAQVEKANTVVMNDGERYDSWSVIINGIVDDETTDGQIIRTLTVGQCFGCEATLDQYCHTGIMKTRVDDCQFVVVAQNDYYGILHQGEKNIRKIEEDQKLVMIKELRRYEDTSAHREVVIKGKPDKLIDLLIDEKLTIDDPNYVDDFFLTYRTFISDPTQITQKLLEWFESPQHSEKVARVVLSWVNNHFNDFESDPRLSEFLEIFDERLQHYETEYMRSWRQLLNLACYTKASIRTIILTRSTRDDILNFQILGGTEQSNNGIYISKVEKNSKTFDAGLRRGDQILSVNGQNFDYISHVRALEILRGTTHLSLTVKNNLMGFYEIVNPEKSPNRKKRHDISLYEREIRSKLQQSPITQHSISVPTALSPVSSSNSPDQHHQPQQRLDNDETIDKLTPSTITPIKITHHDKKPKPLAKRMGFKRALQKFKISRHNKKKVLDDRHYVYIL